MIFLLILLGLAFAGVVITVSLERRERSREADFRTQKAAWEAEQDQKVKHQEAGRQKVYDAIVAGEDQFEGVPPSFEALTKEMKALGLDVPNETIIEQSTLIEDLNLRTQEFISAIEAGDESLEAEQVETHIAIIEEVLRPIMLEDLGQFSSEEAKKMVELSKIEAGQVSIASDITTREGTLKIERITSRLGEAPEVTGRAEFKFHSDNTLGFFTSSDRLARKRKYDRVKLEDIVEVDNELPTESARSDLETLRKKYLELCALAEQLDPQVTNTLLKSASVESAEIETRFSRLIKQFDDLRKKSDTTP